MFHLLKKTSLLCLALLPSLAAAEPIVAQIFKMPETVELAAVTTAGHYVLAYHLVRPLTKLDKFGKIQGDLAQKWQLSKDGKTWTITLTKAKFSNGENIKAEHVAASIERQRKIGGGVHFSFSQITGVKVIDPSTIEISLAGPRNDFIFDLSKPEFGVLSPSDAAAPKGALKLDITSGAYTLLSRTGTTYHLKRSPHFKIDAGNERDLVLESSDGDGSPASLKEGRIAFYTGQQNLSLGKHKEVTENPSLKAERPHIGFSFWVSINPESPVFQTASSRAYLQKLVHEFHSKEMNEHTWEKAHQLYLPDGDGRPSQAQLDRTWSTITARAKAPKSKPKLRVVPLRTTPPMIQELLDYLKPRYDIELVNYATEEELIALLKSGKFDVKLQSNDFSSTDLSENLKTTFNDVRPYIFLAKKSRVKALMQKSVETTDKNVQSGIYKDIATTLLLDGAIAPLAYQRLWFYMKRDLDTSPWSKTHPEISFWKVRGHE